jgi:SAM-dependent methyltransferase
MSWDDWHSEIAWSATCNRIVHEALGLPAGMRSNSLLPWSGIADVCDALRLAPGSLLVDLACGRGGYGQEIAGRAGARLVGLDISAVAIRAAGGAGSSSVTTRRPGCVMAARTR